jgi:hypothetical protein
MMIATLSVLTLLSIRPASAALLSVNPSPASVVAGGTVTMSVLVSSLGDVLGAFDLGVAYDPALLSPTGVTFGPALGDPGLFEALTTSSTATPGVFGISEVSLLGAAQLASLQSAYQFELATLSFVGLANGTVSASFAGGALLVSGGANPTPLVIPEPATTLLVALGALALLRGRGKTSAS